MSDVRKQLQAALVWLAPLVLVYVAQLQGTLQLNDHLAWSDFAPTPVSLGAMQLYVVNQLFGLFNRWKAGK